MSYRTYICRYMRIYVCVYVCTQRRRRYVICTVNFLPPRRRRRRRSVVLQFSSISYFQTHYERARRRIVLEMKSYSSGRKVCNNEVYTCIRAACYIYVRHAALQEKWASQRQVFDFFFLRSFLALSSANSCANRPSSVYRAIHICGKEKLNLWNYSAFYPQSCRREQKRQCRKLRRLVLYDATEIPSSRIFDAL